MARRSLAEARAQEVEEGKSKPFLVLGIVTALAVGLLVGLVMLVSKSNPGTVAAIAWGLLAGVIVCLPALVGWRWRDERKGMMVTGALFLVGWVVGAVALLLV